MAKYRLSPCSYLHILIEMQSCSLCIITLRFLSHRYSFICSWRQALISLSPYRLEQPKTSPSLPASIAGSRMQPLAGTRPSFAYPISYHPNIDESSFAAATLLLQGWRTETRILLYSIFLASLQDKSLVASEGLSRPSYSRATLIADRRSIHARLYPGNAAFPAIFHLRHRISDFHDFKR